MFLNGVNRQNVCSGHVGAALVRPQSLRALGGIAGEADNKYPLMRHLDLILASMQRHSASAVVQVRPCMAVWAMRPLHVSLNALHGGADSPPPPTRVCLVCRAQPRRNKTCVPPHLRCLVASIPPPPLPTRACLLRRARRAGTVQEQALLVLGNMAHDEYNKEALMACVPLVKAAIGRHMASAVVQKQVSAIAVGARLCGCSKSVSGYQLLTGVGVGVCCVSTMLVHGVQQPLSHFVRRAERGVTMCDARVPTSRCHAQAILLLWNLSFHAGNRATLQGDDVLVAAVQLTLDVHGTHYAEELLAWWREGARVADVLPAAGSSGSGDVSL